MSERPPPLSAAELSAEALRWGASKKYRDLAPDTIVDVLQQENRPHVARKGALANARLRLHRIAAHYLGLPKFAKAQAALEAAFASGDDRAILLAVEHVLRAHSSTQERLPHVEMIFEELRARCPAPNKVLDVACAVQPVAWRLTGLPRTTEYLAVDINQKFLELATRYFTLEGVPHRTLWQDVLVQPVTERCDLGLLWKMYHCLEQRRPGAGRQVLETTPTHHLAISFPTASLAGKRMRFHEKHEPEIADAVAQHGWSLDQFEAPGELFYVVTKPEFAPTDDKAA